jgi:hypothetical protein
MGHYWPGGMPAACGLDSGLISEIHLAEHIGTASSTKP